ncbi:MAG TPA: C40 family peptidase [Blastococcus sp.]
MATPSNGAPRTGGASRASAPRFVAVRRAALVVAGVLGVLLSVVPAQATPGTSAEAAQLVAARGHDLEVVTEKFNEARETLAAQQAAAQAAAAQVEQATAALAAAKQQVRGIARTAYTGDGLGSFKALMTSDSADDFVDRIDTLQSIAGHQNGILEQAATANVAAAQAQAEAKKSAAEAQAQYDAVAKEQTDLQAQVAEYKAAFDRLSAQEKQAALAAHAEDQVSRADRQPAGSGPAGSGPAGSAPAAATPAAATPIAAGSQAAQVAVSTAMAQRGKPYVWAAGGPGSFDCSGLTRYAYAAAGVSLPHSSRMQSQIGRSVSRDQLQPGDLVFFYSPVSHVGIYIGNGQMVHAPTSGDVVKVASIDSMGGYAGAKRIG